MIYFVQSGDAPFIKIGFADKWERRLASLQCGNPEKVSLIGFLPGGIKIERALHALLRKHRHRGVRAVRSRPDDGGSGSPMRQRCPF